LNQAGFDLWLTSHPTQHVVFLHPLGHGWHLTGPLELPKQKGPFAMNLQTADEYNQQLRRCLNDTKLPREVCIIGGLVRLYVLPVGKIIEIATARFTQTGRAHQRPDCSASHHHADAPGSGRSVPSICCPASSPTAPATPTEWEIC
jgi:hypothetical protein